MQTGTAYGTSQTEFIHILYCHANIRQPNLSAEQLVAAQKTDCRGNHNDHALGDQHSDHHSNSDAEQHQSQKPPHTSQSLFLKMTVWLQESRSHTAISRFIILYDGSCGK